MSSAAQPLDHGYLNVPLAKRGNIDAQIDAYKAEQAREQKIAYRAGRAQVKEARAMVRAMTDIRLAQLGQRHNLTIIQTRKMMLAAADSRPATVIATLTKEAAQ